MKQTHYILTAILLIICSFGKTEAQQRVTHVKGVVQDAANGEPVAFAYVYFPGKNIAVMTDLKGNFELESRWAGDVLVISSLGYHADTLKVIVGTRQEFQIKLEPNHTVLEAVEVTSRQRETYRNRDNPAVELMRNVIRHKSDNRLESKDYYQYEKYEKTEFSLNNFTEKMWNSRALRDFQFLKRYIDTSTVNGKPYLPMFLKETLSDHFFRKSPRTSRTIVKGSKMVGIDQYFDQSGIDQYLTQLIGNINIYDNDIALLDNRFVSPLSIIAPQFYKFFIRDTLEVKGTPCIHLSFLPRNPEDLGFSGHLYITNDSAYAVKKIVMNFVKKINLNFINDLELEQEFDLFEGMWVLSLDHLTVDFNILESEKVAGIYARRHASYDKFAFDTPLPDSAYSGVAQSLRLSDAEKHSEAYWDSVRHAPLSTSEAGIYTMIDTLKRVPAFKRALDVVMTLITGYVEFKKFDFGPVDAIFSHNEIEGFRFRLGGRTNSGFHKHLFLETYGAYGFSDQKFKYMGEITWSFPEREYHAWEYPINSLSVSYEYNTQIPGQRLFYATSDNILLSFQRGTVDKMTYDRTLNMEYQKEFKGGLGVKLSLKNLESKTAGSLLYAIQQPDESLLKIPGITTTEATLRLRFAPNEKFYQNKRNRIPMNSTSPVIMVQHTLGIKGLMDGAYHFNKTEASIQKRFWISTLGSLDVLGKYGKVWGALPYPLLIIHNANQTYSYRTEAYNMMNFLEFISDEFISVDLHYNMNGFLLNKIPIIKKLKWREVMTFKSLWGNLSDRNMPQNNPGLFVFPTDKDGNPAAFSLGSKPYMEASIGVTNILKLFRIDLVQRLSYRDNPNVSNLGIRGMVYFTF